MEIKEIDICICRHEKKEHYIGHISGLNRCFMCRELYVDEHEFKLDNLLYIETLAKQKGLI
jgi:hypothetical protein